MNNNVLYDFPICDSYQLCYKKPANNFMYNLNDNES